MGIVLDSTVFINAERKGRTVPALLELLNKKFGDQAVVLSAVSAAELVHGVWRAVTPDTRVRREEFVEEIFALVSVQQVDLGVARIAGRIDAECRQRGRTIPAGDLLIAATALHLGFAVATANVRHFKFVPGLRILQID